MATNRKGYTKENYIAAAKDGMTAAEAAKHLGVSSQSVRRMAEKWGIDFKKGKPGRKHAMREELSVAKVNKRTMPGDQYYQLYETLSQCPAVAGGTPRATKMWMVDDSLLATQHMPSVRWVMVDTPHDVLIFSVDALGDATMLVRGE